MAFIITLDTTLTKESIPLYLLKHFHIAVHIQKTEFNIFLTLCTEKPASPIFFSLCYVVQWESAPLRTEIKSLKAEAALFICVYVCV